MKLSLVLAFRSHRDCCDIFGESRRADHQQCSRRRTRALWQPALRMALNYPAQAEGILSWKGRLPPGSRFPAAEVRTRTELHVD